MKKPNYWIQTYTGGAFDFENPENHLFSVKDIARSLALIPRFNGHTNRHYSVAEHSVRASYLAPEGFEFEALMHDTSEAYVCDVPTPLKKLLPDYRKIQERVEHAIAEQFVFPKEMSPEVKKVDTRLLLTECKLLLTVPPFKWADYGDLAPYSDVEFRNAYFQGEEPENAFGRRFDELYHNKNT